MMKYLGDSRHTTRQTSRGRRLGFYIYRNHRRRSNDIQPTTVKLRPKAPARLQIAILKILPINIRLRVITVTLKMLIYIIKYIIFLNIIRMMTMTFCY